MTSKELPEKLLSEAASDRRAALDELGELGEDQRNQLHILRASEPDRWVRYSMDRHLGPAPIAATESDAQSYTPVDAETAEEIRDQASGEIAELLVHELKHASLHIELEAEREIDDYQKSNTRKAIDRFRIMAESLRQLADSTKGARLVEASLGDVIEQAVAGMATSFWPPQLWGPSEVFVRVDPGLLILAVSNCVRNAIDASMAARHTAGPVTVTWGHTDRDAWVAIHDDGVGISGDISQMFEAHHTTKGGSGHSGLGLNIAQNSLHAMDGRVTLGPREPRGALCELRWPQDPR